MDIINDIDKLNDAAWNGNLDLVKEFVANGVNLNAISSNRTTALISACRRQNEKVVEYLLEHGADPNITVTVVNEEGYTDNWTALMASTCKGDKPNIAQLLIKKGARIDIRNSNGETALDLAYKYNRNRTINILEIAV